MTVELTVNSNTSTIDNGSLNKKKTLTNYHLQQYTTPNIINTQFAWTYSIYN